MASFYYAVTIKSDVELEDDDVREALGYHLGSNVQVLEFELEDDEYADV